MRALDAVLVIIGATCLLQAESSDVTRRLDAAADVFSEVMATPDKAIPQDLLDKAHCIAVVPGLKQGAFIFGAKYGKGFFSCRKKNGPGWIAPASIRVEGGSFGLQIGGSEIDIIMLVMNPRGAERLLSSKFTLGGAGEVAAGPVGRRASAQTDAYMTAEILSWSRARGVFAGISLQGATLRQDLDDNRALYGKKIENREIVQQELAVPAPAKRLISTLSKYSSKES
ncbi:MAG: lipid-binding SYLF domain-containing protein [Bryobacterales bacterium]|nr:lipid-binding SYLF domain-containing protein [Bryobacterales bacterium]